MMVWETTRSSAGPGFLGQQEFVQAVVHLGKFARALVAHQMDALHRRAQPLIIARVAAQPHEVFGEAEDDGAHLFARRFADFLGEFVDALRGILPRGKLLQDILDALEFLARHQRFFQLLQVDRRAVVVADVPQLVAGQNVHEQIALLEPDDQFLEQSRRACSAALPRGSPGAAGSNRRRAFSGWFK